MDESKLLEVVMYMVPVILSITVHEYAHALASFKLGDDTAAQLGRLTLNPIAHIDPVGTIIIPIFAIMSGAPFFGWAKPVPFNPLRFHRTVRMKTATMIVALAGPVSNLCLALAMVVAGRLLFGGQDYAVLRGSGLFSLVNHLMIVNVALAVFNFVPIPPLDGSKILYGILPESAFGVLEFIEKYSFFLFIALLLWGSRIVSVPINFILILFYSLMGLSG